MAVLDFAQFLNYIAIEVPINCGDKKGRIFTFSHKDHLKNGLLANYKTRLQELIERKKYCDSKKFGDDIGPTAAIANLVEDDEYAEFVKEFNNEKLKLTGLEHVLCCEENINGKDMTHYILPIDDELNFINREQDALIRYSIFFRRLVDPNKSINEGAIEWIFDNSRGSNGKAKIFREEILEKSRRNAIESYPRIYSNCAIYKNLFKEILQKFQLSEKDVENTIKIKKAADVFKN